MITIILVVPILILYVFDMPANTLYSRARRALFRTVLDLPKPKYCGAPNLCEDLY